MMLTKEELLKKSDEFDGKDMSTLPAYVAWLETLSYEETNTLFKAMEERFFASLPGAQKRQEVAK